MTDINKPTGGDNEKHTNIQELTEGKRNEISATLFGDKEAILNDLQENYVKIEENAEIMGYKGEKVHINLPAVGNFEGFKFDYFVSNHEVYKVDFESNPELEKKSYSMKEIGDIIKAMNRYMKELGVETDGDIDYEDDLQYWKWHRGYRCKAGDCLKNITGLDFRYWTSDKGVDSVENSRVIRGRDECCNFTRSGSDGADANLFLRLSD